MTPTAKRDAAAEAYGLKVSKHRYERSPMAYVTGEPRPWDNRPDFIATSAFKAGWDAAIAELSSGAGEFDPNDEVIPAAKAAFDNDPTLMPDPWATFAHGARWQHSQSQAKLRAMEVEVSRLKQANREAGRLLEKGRLLLGEKAALLRAKDMALKFYAQERLYVNIGLQQDLYNDKGEQARQALAERGERG